MNKRYKIRVAFLAVGGLVAAIILIGVLMKKRSPAVVDGEDGQGRRAEEGVGQPMIDRALREYEEENRLKLDTLFGVNQEINFYGKVVDENGDPVPGASVEISVPRADGGGKDYVLSTDALGYFGKSGMRGHLATATASHPEFYRLKASSVQVRGPRSNDLAQSPATRVTLQLKRKGNPVELDEIRMQARDTRSGVPVYFKFPNSARASVDDHDLMGLVVIQRAEESNVSWSLNLRVPGGGLIERKDPWAFIAPEGGYSEEVTFTLSHRLYEKEFFIKLADGRFARVELKAAVRGFQFIRIEGWMNPVGGRNLERLTSSSFPD